MLQKTSIIIALALTLALPMGSSEEMEEEYAALGVGEGVTGEDLGLGIGIAADPKHCPECSSVPPVGVVYLSPVLPYEHLELSIGDVVFEQPASHVCLLNPYGDFRCDDDDHAVGMGCGARLVGDLPVVADTIQVFLYSVYVSSSLDVCLASTGTVRATFT